jgi:hypothetical protein
MEQLIDVNIGSMIGFYAIVIVLGFFLHLGLSKTGLYKRKIKTKGFFSKFLYICIFLVILYILLLVIFGVIKLISS